MNRTGREHHELEKEIANSNIAQLLEIFKRESEKYNSRGIEYAECHMKLTEEEKNQWGEEAALLHEGREKIAFRIAEILIDNKSV